MKEHGTITTDRKYYSTKKKCLKKTWKCIVLDSIFGLILLRLVLKGLVMRKEGSIKFIEMSLRKLRFRKGKLLRGGKTRMKSK